MKILLVLMMVIMSTVMMSNVEMATAQNTTNSTIPQNAIRTPDGGWVTPPQTQDENGKNLTIHYETGVQVSGYANPGPPPDPIFLTDSKGNIDNFLTNHQILMRADVWPRSPDARTADIEINMTSDTGFVFDDKKHIIFENDSNHEQQIVWQFILTKAGNYSVDKFSNGIHTSTTLFSVSDSKANQDFIMLVSPLKQFKWGILPEHIQCEYNRELLYKIKDNSPACVKFSTAKILIERGWGVIPMGGLTPDGNPSVGIDILYNGTRSSLDNPFYLKQGQNVTLMINVTSDSANIPVTLYVDPHTGINKTNGMDLQLSDTVVNAPAKVMLYMSVGKNAMPSVYGVLVRGDSIGGIEYLNFYVKVMK
jgi:hypothetical protein